jgi:hypothetical protein
MRYSLEEHQGYAAELEKLRRLEQRLQVAQAELEKARARLAEVDERNEQLIREDATKFLSGAEPKARKIGEARRQAMEAVEEAEYLVRVTEAAILQQREIAEGKKQEAKTKLLRQIRGEHEKIVRAIYDELVKLQALYSQEKEIRTEAEKVLERPLVAAPIEHTPLLPPPARLDPGDPENPNSLLVIFRKEMIDSGYGKL